MSDSQDISTADQSKYNHDRVRGRKQKQKWALGEAHPTRGQPGRRPMKPPGQKFCQMAGREVGFLKNKDTKLEKMSRDRASRPDTDPDISDHEEEARGAFRGIAPDAGYTYSYDAKKSANKGSQILGQAVAKAVEKYEVKATEKLVKDEYEIVGHEKTDSHSEASTEEDDFELL